MAQNKPVPPKTIICATSLSSGVGKGFMSVVLKSKADGICVVGRGRA